MADLIAPALQGMRLAFYLPSLAGGGAERMTLTLIGALLGRGAQVTLLLSRGGGELAGQVPAGCAVLAFGSGRTALDLPHLLRTLRAQRPDVLIAGMSHNNLLALAAGRLARAGTRVVIVLHNTLSAEAGGGAALGYRVLPVLYRLLARSAAGIVAVSHGVAEDMAARTGTPRDSVRVLYNPVIDAGFAARAAAPCAHPWLQRDTAVATYVAVGRLVAQKDHATLLRALQLRQAQGPARLVVLGDGPERARLETLAATLGIAGDVCFAGFVANPLPFIRAATAFVLPSRYEGFGIVLVEALGCGTPVIATDCPHGPAEVLAGGEHGVLVPVGDAVAMAGAMGRDLRARWPEAALQARAAAFASDHIADLYAGFLQRVWRGQGRLPDPAAAA